VPPSSLKMTANICDDRHEQHLNLLDQLVALAFRSARVIAINRRNKYYREKGRLPTDRAWKTWAAKCLKREANAVLNEAFCAVKEHEQPMLHWEAINFYLDDALQESTRGPGRPAQSQGLGMLKSVGCNPKRRTPSGIGSTPVNKRQNLAFVYGVKLRLYVRAKGLQHDITRAEAVQLLARDCDFHRSVDLSDRLDARIPDRQVALNQAVIDRFNLKPKTLEKRLQRSRKGCRYVITET